MNSSRDKNPLLRINNLTKYYTVKQSLLTKLLTKHKDIDVKAVDGVNLQVNRKQTVGLVGESGCGKTSLGRTVIRLQDITGGEILYDGQDISKFSGEDLQQYRHKMQMIFQNPYASLNARKTVRDIIGVPLRNRGIKEPGEREEIVRDLLDRVGLSPRHINLYPHQFSGGQRQRIGVARALAMQPEFIVADEPVSALDVSVQAQIINLLEDLQEEFGLTYLFIAHDLSVIYYISDMVAVMYLGKIVEMAPTGELFKHPLHPYTKALFSAIPVVERESRRERIILEGTVPSPMDPPPGCRFHTRCFNRKGGCCSEEEPAWQEVSPQHWVACHHYAGGKQED